MELEEIYRGEAGGDYEGFQCSFCYELVEEDENVVVAFNNRGEERIYHEDCYDGSVNPKEEG